MAALTVCTWLWGTKYNASYVEKLAAGLWRHLKQPHRFVCISDRRDGLPSGIETIDIPDPELLAVKGCFARLRMFDPQWQWWNEIERLVCIDLDVVITGALDPLFDRREPFVILQGANSSNPCAFNGSVWMLHAGHRPDVWNDFSLEAAAKIRFHEFPDDQGWFWHKMPDAAGWKVGQESGIYAFHKPGWPKGDNLPAGARIVTFPGHRDPSQFQRLGWVNTHWRA